MTNSTNKLKKNPKGFIVYHQGGMGQVLDAFVKKGDRRENPFNYRMESCGYVKSFLKEHKGYKLLGTDDFAHISVFNDGVYDSVKRLRKEGFVQVVA